MTDEVESVLLTPAEGVRFDPSEWEARAHGVLASLVPEDETSPDDVAAALRELFLRDQQQVTWTYDGRTWLGWINGAWAAGRPSGPLHLLPFRFEIVPETPERPPLGVPPLRETIDDALPRDTNAPPDIEPTPAWVAPGAAVSAASFSYRRTHVVPASGLPIWAAADANVGPVGRLDPWLDVMVLEQHPNGWARIICSNGWGGWVDGRLLTAS